MSATPVREIVPSPYSGREATLVGEIEWLEKEVGTTRLLRKMADTQIAGLQQRVEELSHSMRDVIGGRFGRPDRDISYHLEAALDKIGGGS